VRQDGVFGNARLARLDDLHEAVVEVVREAGRPRGLDLLDLVAVAVVGEGRHARVVGQRHELIEGVFDQVAISERPGSA
jgi:hypothetical protein